MRRTVAVIVPVLALLALGTAPLPARAQAAAPAPKVTINGLVDFVATAYKNLSGLDISTSSDHGAYSRERGIFTFTGEVGRSKGVLSLELDIVNGQTGNSDRLALGPGAGASFDLDTDIKRQLEVKWLYLETPITGPGSLLSFIPVATIGRFGGQPVRGHEYKIGILFGGDFGGITLETAWTPTVRSTLTYVQIDEALDPVITPGQTEDFAFLGSVEWTPAKGLTIKPTYAFVRFDGGNGGTANFGTFGRGGFNPNAQGAILSNSRQTNKAETRHNIGGDVRWTVGPWTLQPTFIFQWGSQEVDPLSNGKGVDDVAIRSWIFDGIGSYRSGPWRLETRFVWTPGMAANQCVQAVAGVCRGGSDITYYQPIHSGSLLYFAGWSEIESAGIDYELPLHDSNINPLTLAANPSYDKYGRIALAGAADYSLTPALVLHLQGLAQWTDRKVDTDGVLNAVSSGIIPTSRGDARYLGTEVDAGLTYRFAPNVAFDVMGGVLFVGEARDHARTSGGVRKGAEDVYKLTSRIRITW